MSEKFCSKERLTRTYNTPSYADPAEVLHDYQQVMRYASLHPNKGDSAVASHFDLPRGRVRSWMEGSKPDAVRGVDRAREHGWVPLDEDSELIEAMTKLMAWVMSGGSINAHWVPSFAIDNAEQQSNVLNLLSEVGLNGEVVERGAGRATEIVPGEDGSVLGRVLHVLGAPVGDKNTGADVSLPTWLWEAPDDVKRAFVDVYLSNRGQRFDDKDTVTLREERSDAYLNDLARFIAEVAGAPVRRNDKNVVVSAEAARALGVARLT